MVPSHPIGDKFCNLIERLLLNTYHCCFRSDWLFLNLFRKYCCCFFFSLISSTTYEENFFIQYLPFLFSLSNSLIHWNLPYILLTFSSQLFLMLNLLLQLLMLKQLLLLQLLPLPLLLYKNNTSYVTGKCHTE